MWKVKLIGANGKTLQVDYNKDTGYVVDLVRVASDVLLPGERLELSRLPETREV